MTEVIKTASKKKISIAIIIMNRDRPELTDKVVEQVNKMGSDFDTHLVVVEAGSQKDKQSKYATHYFRDKHYKGRYYAFNKGLSFAWEHKARYDYYWFVVNDIIFPEGEDTLKLLWEAMQDDPRMACIGPGEPEAEDYKGCHPKPGRKWHKASTIHGLAMLMRGDALHDVGYCRDHFHYAQGAGTELSYLLYKHNWFMAYSDMAHIYHDQTGSTYGVVTKISRHEYHRRARNYASSYLRGKYGENWDNLFSSVLPEDIEENTFHWQKKVWETKLDRNWREVCPGFWALGSRIKKIIGLSKS